MEYLEFGHFCSAFGLRLLRRSLIGRIDKVCEEFAQIAKIVLDSKNPLHFSGCANTLLAANPELNTNRQFPKIANMNWYYANAGQPIGPLSHTDFDGLVHAGTVNPETLVWREGMASWQP